MHVKRGNTKREKEKPLAQKEEEAKLNLLEEAKSLLLWVIRKERGRNEKEMEVRGGSAPSIFF